jgi:hypothetical protein
MTGFRQLGNNATLQQVRDQRRNDAKVVDFLLEFKLQGRDRTGLRAVPTADDDVIKLSGGLGDILGDIVYDFTGNKKYELVNNNGTIQWIYYTIVSSF